MRLARLLGFLVLFIFLIAVFFSLLTAIGKEDVLNNLAKEDPITEELPEESLDQDSLETVDLGEGENLLGEYRMGRPEISDLYVVKDAKLSDIKRLVAKDVTVMVLVDTDKLQNPFYDSNGFAYVSVTGFTETHIETIDIDKSSGEFFVYLDKDFAKAMESAGGLLLYRL